MPQRYYPVGAEVQSDGRVHVRVWAPRCRRVEVVEVAAEGGMAAQNRDGVTLATEAEGYHSGIVPGLAAGSLYVLRLDEGECWPDPASRFQPRGALEASQVVDPALFQWSDHGWAGLELAGQVFYELHIGTFTAEGTWNAAARELERLAGLGITAIELMPVAAWPGRFGWGYDVVSLFAPYQEYGTPDDMRRFVDTAHGLGIGVILDVVYNHFGPEGAMHERFSATYYHHEHPGNEWGRTLNFDGPGSGPVREFFKANAAYWIDEFHLDGLRLDATQAIHDESTPHILTELTAAAREAAGDRSVLIVAENEPQDVRLITGAGQGGYGLDALWNDDFHHAAVVALTGRAEGYLADYGGTPHELLAAARHGFLYQGQFIKWQQKRRGTLTRGVPAARFMTFLENHDQIANTGRGQRLRDRSAPASYRAMVGFWLLSPQTPMLFQGQERGDRTPFCYFSDYEEPLRTLIDKGRLDGLGVLRSAAHSDMRACLPAAVGRETFEMSKQGNKADDERLFIRLFGDLLRLRREDPAIRGQRADRLDGAVIGPHALCLRYEGESVAEERLLVLNLGRDLYPVAPTEPLLAPPLDHDWDVLWYSEHPCYGGNGMPGLEPGRPWRLTGHACALLRPVRRVEGRLPMRFDDPDIHPGVVETWRKQMIVGE